MTKVAYLVANNHLAGANDRGDVANNAVSLQIIFWDLQK